MPLLLGLKHNSEYFSSYNKALNDYRSAKWSKEERQKNKKEIDNLFHKCQEEEIKYFSEHLDELCTKIKDYVQNNVETIRLGLSFNDEWVKKIYFEERRIRSTHIRELKP